MSKHNQHRRSHILNHPLLRKSSIHQKTNKAKRRQDKVNLKKELPPKRQLREVVC